MKKRNLSAIICIAALVVSLFAALLTMQASADVSGSTATVSTDTELRSFRDDPNVSRVYIDVDMIEVTSYIRINAVGARNTVVFEPAPGRDRVTLKWVENHANYMIYVGDNANIVFRNIDIIGRSQNFNPSININVGGSVKFDNCTIEYTSGATVAPRLFYSGDSSLSTFYIFKDTQVNIPETMTTAFYRTNAVLSGTTAFTVLTKSSDSQVYDFRSVSIDVSAENGLVTLTKTGDIISGIAPSTTVIPDYKLFYTVDGQDPAENGILYDAPFASPALDDTPLKVALFATIGSKDLLCPNIFEATLNPTKVYNVTNEAQLKAAAEEVIDAKKIINVMNDISFINLTIKGKCVIRTDKGFIKNNGRKAVLTMTGFEYHNKILPANGSDVTFSNIDIFHEKTLNASTSNVTIEYSAASVRLYNVKITNLNNFRILYCSSASSDSNVYLYNVEFAAEAGASFAAMYRGNYIIDGDLILNNGTIGGSAVVFDFRPYDVTASDEGGLTSLTLSGTGKTGGTLPAPTDMTDAEIWYTLDGTNPATSLSAEKYTAPIPTPSWQNALISVCVKANGYFSPEVYEFKYNVVIEIPDVTAEDLIIDYAAETLSFSSDIEVNTAADFSGEVFVSGSQVIPGSVLYARYKATDELPAGDVFTFNVPQRPATPQVTAASISVNRITLAQIAGAEYKLSSESEWTAERIFTGLAADTEYSFDVRIAATASSFASDIATETFRTLAQFGEVAEADYSIVFAQQKIVFEADIEANTESDFTGTAIESGDIVTPGTTIYLRYKAVDAIPAGPSTEVVLPEAPEFTGSLSVKAVNKSMIQLNTVVNSEFSLDGETWQSNTLFTGLEPLTQYTIYARNKGTADAFPSKVASITVTTSDSDWVILEVSTYEAFREALENQSMPYKHVYVTADFTGSSTINVYGEVIIEPKNVERAKITYNGNNNMLYFRTNSVTTINNIDFEYDTEAAYGVFYFYDATTVLYMNGCSIKSTRNQYRTFHASKAGSLIYLTDTVIDDENSVTFYRGDFILYGQTSYKGTENLANSYARIFDYRGVELSASIDNNFKVTISYNKLPAFSGYQVTNENVKIYYTTDGSDPLTSETALEYTAPVEITQLTTFRYILADKSSEVKTSLNRDYSSSFFKYTINYIERKISWNEDEIELSTDEDFASLLSDGASITPGQKLYGRIKNNPSETFEIDIPAQPQAPQGIALVSRTDVQVTVTSDSSVEYSLNGTDWQDISTFTGLIKNTQYTIYFRYKATSSAFCSQAGSIQVTTMGKQGDVDEEDITIDYFNKIITFDSKYEVSTSQSFAAGTFIASGSKIQPGMKLYIRIKADENNVAGNILVYDVKQKPATPSAPSYTSTKNSITVEYIEGAEYRLGDDENAEWQESNEFLGLAADTEYTIYVRIAATNNSFESEAVSIVAVTKSDAAEKGGCGCGSAVSETAMIISALLLIFAASALAIKRKKS